MSDGHWPKDRGIELARRIIVAASGLVPFPRRGAWRAELEAELWVLHRKGWGRARLIRFALDAFGVALWERRREEGMMGGFTHDLVLAARRLRRSPGFTATTILVLGVGIGANTALFSALDAALLHAPPFPDVERIVLVDLLLESRAGEPADTMGWSYPKFEMGRERLTSVERLAGLSLASVTMTGTGDPTRLGVEYVTPDYFQLLGARPALGRLLTPDEEYPAEPAVALLSHGLWTTRFGADPEVVGRSITLEGTSVEVVGVLERGFQGLTGAPDLWVPMAGIAAIQGPRRLRLAWAHWVRAVARLRPGVSLEDARSEAERLGAEITERYPDPDGGGRHGVAIVPFMAARVNPVARTAVAAVSAGAILFLLIACGNVASLLLARASARRTDVAVRAALGAARPRLVREHLLESMLLATSGGLLGLAIAVAGGRVVASAVRHAVDTKGSRGLLYIDPETMAADTPVLVVGLALALLIGLVFGLIPSWSAAGVSPAHDLRLSDGGTMRRWRPGGGETARGLLVSAQLALTLVLLAGAGLMGSSLARLSGLESGVRSDDVLALSYVRGTSSGEEQNRAFVSGMLERIGALPGVLEASAVTCPPLAGRRCEVMGLRQVDDGEPADVSEMRGVLVYSVTERFFATVGAPVVEGRVLARSDGAGDAPVVVVNESAARSLFPGTSAVGHRLAITHSLTAEGMATVVGVVGDVRYGSPEQPIMPAVYLSERQAPMAYGTLLVRTAGDPYAALDDVRRIAGTLDPNLPFYEITTLAELDAAGTARTRIVLGLLVAFALSGLVLSALGLYGLVSYAVVRRTREVGLRMALGAEGGAVRRLVAMRPTLLATAGAGAGLVGAAMLTRYLEALLFATEAADPLVLASAAAVLLAVAVTAAWLPAGRATRIAPARALRGD